MVSKKNVKNILFIYFLAKYYINYYMFFDIKNLHKSYFSSRKYTFFDHKYTF